MRPKDSVSARALLAVLVAGILLGVGLAVLLVENPTGYAVQVFGAVGGAFAVVLYMLLNYPKSPS
jgi:uncharacterized integral membrane protein